MARKVPFFGSWVAYLYLKVFTEIGSGLMKTIY
jgi:hypothetical protein